MLYHPTPSNSTQLSTLPLFRKITKSHYSTPLGLPPISHAPLLNFHGKGTAPLASPPNPSALSHIHTYTYTHQDMPSHLPREKRVESASAAAAARAQILIYTPRLAVFLMRRRLSLARVNRLYIYISARGCKDLVKRRGDLYRPSTIYPRRKNNSIWLYFTVFKECARSR